MGVLADRVRAVVPAIVAAGPQGGTRGGGAVDGDPVGPRRRLPGAFQSLRLSRQRRRTEPPGPRAIGRGMSRRGGTAARQPLSAVTEQDTPATPPSLNSATASRGRGGDEGHAPTSRHRSTRTQKLKKLGWVLFF